MEKIMKSRTVSELTGEGEEWLVDAEDNVIAIFYDGCFKRAMPALTKEEQEANTIAA